MRLKVLYLRNRAFADGMDVYSGRSCELRPPEARGRRCRSAPELLRGMNAGLEHTRLKDDRLRNRDNKFSTVFAIAPILLQDFFGKIPGEKQDVIRFVLVQL